MRHIYDLHIPFVIAFLVLAVIFVMALAREGQR
jgi:uncharacterized membrane protein